MTDKEITESGDAQDTRSGAGNDGGKGKLEVRHTPEELTQRVVELSQENKKRKLASQALQAERDELAAKLRAQEEGLLNEQGKFKDLYEKTSKELATTKDEAKNIRLNFARQVVTSQFSAAAAQAGCANTEHLVKFAATLGILDDLDVDSEKFTISADSMKGALEKAQKELPYLFSRSAPLVKDGIPSSKGAAAGKPSLSDIPFADRLRMAAEGMAAGDYQSEKPK